MTIRTQVIGPRQHYVDHTGDWARVRENGDIGCLLVRPDQHVCWRIEELAEDSEVELRGALSSVLGRDGSKAMAEE